MQKLSQWYIDEERKKKQKIAAVRLKTNKKNDEEKNCIFLSNDYEVIIPLKQYRTKA